MIDIIIENGTILTQNKDREIIKNGSVVIEKDRIIDVGKTEELKGKYSADKVVNAKKKLVMPGLINCHFHVYVTPKGLYPDATASLKPRQMIEQYVFPARKALTAEEEYWGTLNHMAEMIKTGTTSFADMGTVFIDKTVNAFKQSGMRCVFGPYTWDKPGVLPKGVPMREILSTDKALERIESSIKKYDGIEGGRIRVHAPNIGWGWGCTDELLVGGKKLADKYDTRFYLNCSCDIKEVELTKKHTGHRPTEHLNELGVLDSNTVLIHEVFVDEDEIEMIKEHKAKVVHNPTSCFRQHKGCARYGKFAEMLEAGIDVGLGTDGPSSGGTFDMLRIGEFSLGMMLDKVQAPKIATAEKTVEMLTTMGAKVLGLKDVGSIEKGKKADIIILDLRRPEWVPIFNVVLNLIWTASGSSVVTNIVDGKILMEDGILKTINELEVVDKVQEIREDYINRARKEAPDSIWPSTEDLI